MKKINSIGFGPVCIALIAVFLIGLPAAGALLRLFIPSPVLSVAIRVSAILGGGFLLAFLVVLAVEFHQDRTINKAYETGKCRKQQTKDGHFECQVCGYADLKASDAYCTSCYTRFMEDDECGRTL